MKLGKDELMYIGRSLNKSPLRSHYGTTILSKLQNERKVSDQEILYLNVAIQFNKENTDINRQGLIRKMYKHKIKSVVEEPEE